jgi:hypothetical protein
MTLQGPRRPCGLGEEGALCGQKLAHLVPLAGELVVRRVVLDPNDDTNVHAAEGLACVSRPERLEVEIGLQLQELLLRPADRLVRERGVHQQIEVRPVTGPGNDDPPGQHRLARTLAHTVLDAVDVPLVGPCGQDFELRFGDVTEIERVRQVLVVVLALIAAFGITRERLVERVLAGLVVLLRFLQDGCLWGALRRTRRTLGGVAALLLVWCLGHL